MATLMFQPGKVGFDWSQGRVTEVYPGTQASAAGVQRGWNIRYVNGNDFTDDALSKCMAGKNPFLLVFDKPRLDMNMLMPMAMGASPMGDMGGMDMSMAPRISIQNGQIVFQTAGPGGMVEVAMRQEEGKGFSITTRTAEIDGDGNYATDTRTFSAKHDDSGKLQTKQCQETSVGNQKQGIKETKQASSSTETGMQRKALERQLPGQARKVVKEKSRNGEERTVEMTKDLANTLTDKAEHTDVFDKRWHEQAAPNLPQHGNWSKWEEFQQTLANDPRWEAPKNIQDETPEDDDEERRKWDWIRQQLRQEDEQIRATQPSSQKQLGPHVKKEEPVVLKTHGKLAQKQNLDEQHAARATPEKVDKLRDLTKKQNQKAPQATANDRSEPKVQEVNVVKHAEQITARAKSANKVAPKATARGAVQARGREEHIEMNGTSPADTSAQKTLQAKVASKASSPEVTEAQTNQAKGKENDSIVDSSMPALKTPVRKVPQAKAASKVVPETRGKVEAGQTHGNANENEIVANLPAVKKSDLNVTQEKIVSKVLPGTSEVETELKQGLERDNETPDNEKPVAPPPSKPVSLFFARPLLHMAA